MLLKREVGEEKGLGVQPAALALPALERAPAQFLSWGNEPESWLPAGASGIPIPAAGRMIPTQSPRGAPKQRRGPDPGQWLMSLSLRRSSQAPVGRGSQEPVHHQDMPPAGTHLSAGSRFGAGAEQTLHSCKTAPAVQRLRGTHAHSMQHAIKIRKRLIKHSN